MKILTDTHSHTIASSHAYSTIAENARAAAEQGLALLAITDHAPGIIDGANRMHFMNYHVLEKEMFGVQMLYGAELNILDYDGNLDLDEEIYKRMDLCIASFHNFVLTPGSKAENTRAMVQAMQNPYVGILGHPDDGNIPVDFEELVVQAKRANVLLEVNNSSLKAAYYRLNTRENLITMLSLCEKHGAMVTVGSDAHVASAIGKTEEAKQLLEEIRFPEELVISTNPALLKKYLAEKKPR